MNIKKKLIDLNYAMLQLEYGELECGGNFETDSYHVKEFLNVLPTVDAVEVVHGQWSPIMEYEVCSQCGYEINRGKQNRTAFLLENRYCRYCGAKMDE